MILDALKKDLITAMKERDPFKTGVVRFLLSKIKNREIELRTEDSELTDKDILRVLKKQIKQRKQSIEQFEQAGRKESAETETKELEILQTYFDKYCEELGIVFEQKGPPQDVPNKNNE